MRRIVFLMLVIGWVRPMIVLSQTGSKMGEVRLSNSSQERRKALVIGNMKYSGMSRLNNTERDADSMTVVLKVLGFEVSTHKSLDRKRMADVFKRFYETLRPNDIVVLYYSGHGIGYDGTNFMLPIDFDIRCADDLKNYNELSLNKLLENINQKQVGNCFVFLDACRNNISLPKTCNAKDGGAVQGLSRPKDNPEGMYIVYATAEGNTADDDTYDKVNSLFTSELIKHLRTPGWSHRKIIDETSKRVKEISKQKQRPAKYETMDDEFFFLAAGQRSVPLPKVEKSKPEVQKLGNGVSRKDNYSYSPTLIYVEGGKFMMGSNSGSETEKPAHQVSLDAFWIGQYEITVKEYLAFVNETNQHFPEWLDKNSGYHINLDDSNYYASRGLGNLQSELPIVGIGWKDAQAYCDWLSKKTNRKYRLPTEAEWEYAASGGNKSKDYLYAGSNDINEVGWVGGNSDNQLHIVGSKKANAIGLYDMSGNAWEWCADWFGAYSEMAQNNPLYLLGDKKFKVVRGGSFGYTPDNARISFRTPIAPTTRFEFTGFRVVCEIEK